MGSVLQSIQSSLYQRGISTRPTGPTRYAGRAAQARWGIVPKACLVVHPTTGGFVIDATVAADPKGVVLTALVLACLVFFPAALIGALLILQDWQKRRAELLAAVWGAVAHQIAAPLPSDQRS